AHCDRGDHVSAAEPGQPPLALLRRRELGQVGGHHVVVQAETQSGAARANNFLGQYGVEPEVLLPATAVLIRHVEGEQPGRSRLAPYLAVDQSGLLPAGVVRDGLPFQERTAQAPELLVYGLIEGLLHDRRLAGRPTTNQVLGVGSWPVTVVW